MMEREKQIIGALIVIIMILLVVTTYSLTINTLQPQNQTHKGSVANLTGNNTTLNSTAVTPSNTHSNDNDGDEKTFPGPHGEGSYHVGDVVDDHDNLMQLQSDGQWVKIGVAEHNDKPDTSSNNGNNVEKKDDSNDQSDEDLELYIDDFGRASLGHWDNDGRFEVVEQL